jgi:endonuclease/exonuclease/phosphatase family metal-dependent hydrolase
VLYRTARLRLDQVTTRWFSDTPDMPGSTGWGNRLPRIVTFACFTDLVGGGRFGFADCHLEGSPAAARHRSAAALATWLDPCLPWILAGDLNAEPHDAAVRTLLDAGLRDVFAPGVAASRPAARRTPGGGSVAHPGPPAAHPGTPTAAPVTTVPEPRSGAAGRRIDYLLVTGEWEVVAAAVPAPGRHRRRASDHRPVLATVRLPAGTALPTLGPTATSDQLEEQR